VIQPFQFSDLLSNNQLLTRFYASLHAANPALLSASSKRYTIAPPSIHKEGNKKTIFANVTDICKKMHRQVPTSPHLILSSLIPMQPEHVIQFLFAEMGTTGSVDGAGRLVIKGRFQQKQVENVLRRYIGTSSFTIISENPDCLLSIPFSESSCPLFSRIRNLQNLQIPRYTPHKGEPYLFHGMRVLW